MASRWKPSILLVSCILALGIASTKSVIGHPANEHQNQDHANDDLSRSNQGHWPVDEPTGNGGSSHSDDGSTDLSDHFSTLMNAPHEKIQAVKHLLNSQREGATSGQQSKPVFCTHKGSQYAEGQAVTIEEQPCLNCTCRRAVLQCFLRVCPPIVSLELAHKRLHGIDWNPETCRVVKEAGHCCPTMRCDDPSADHNQNASRSTSTAATPTESTSASSISINLVSGGPHMVTVVTNDNVTSGPEQSRAQPVASKAAARDSILLISSSGSAPHVHHNAHRPPPNGTALAALHSATSGSNGGHALVPGATADTNKPIAPIQGDHQALLEALLETVYSSAAQLNGGLQLAGSCMINGSLYVEGSAVLPESQASSCQYCYCIRQKVMCVRPRCQLAISGCSPRFSSEFACCPTSYACSPNADDQSLAGVGRVSSSSDAGRLAHSSGAGSLLASKLSAALESIGRLASFTGHRSAADGLVETPRQMDDGDMLALIKASPEVSSISSSSPATTPNSSTTTAATPPSTTTTTTASTTTTTSSTTTTSTTTTPAPTTVSGGLGEVEPTTNAPTGALEEAGEEEESPKDDKDETINNEDQNDNNENSDKKEAADRDDKKQEDANERDTTRPVKVKPRLGVRRKVPKGRRKAEQLQPSERNRPTGGKTNESKQLRNRTSSPDSEFLEPMTRLGPLVVPAAAPSSCQINGRRYEIGEQIPTLESCQHCYCGLEGSKECKTIECTLRVSHGCRPVIPEGHCCPIRYDCPPVGTLRNQNTGVDVNTQQHQSELRLRNAEETPIDILNRCLLGDCSTSSNGSSTERPTLSSAAGDAPGIDPISPQPIRIGLEDINGLGERIPLVSSFRSIDGLDSSANTSSLTDELNQFIMQIKNNNSHPTNMAGPQPDYLFSGNPITPFGAPMSELNSTGQNGSRSQLPNDFDYHSVSAPVQMPPGVIGIPSIQPELIGSLNHASPVASSSSGGSQRDSRAAARLMSTITNNSSRLTFPISGVDDMLQDILANQNTSGISIQNSLRPRNPMVIFDDDAGTMHLANGGDVMDSNEALRGGSPSPVASPQFENLIGSSPAIPTVAPFAPQPTTGTPIGLDTDRSPDTRVWMKSISNAVRSFGLRLNPTGSESLQGAASGPSEPTARSTDSNPSGSSSFINSFFKNLYSGVSNVAPENDDRHTSGPTDHLVMRPLMNQAATISVVASNGAADDTESRAAVPPYDSSGLSTSSSNVEIITAASPVDPDAFGKSSEPERPHKGNPKLSVISSSSSQFARRSDEDSTPTDEIMDNEAQPMVGQFPPAPIRQLGSLVGATMSNVANSSPKQQLTCHDPMNNKTYMPNEIIPKGDPCKTCTCILGQELCQILVCPPRPGDNCREEQRPGECCPNYLCGADGGNGGGPSPVPRVPIQPLNPRATPTSPHERSLRVDTEGSPNNLSPPQPFQLNRSNSIHNQPQKHQNNNQQQKQQLQQTNSQPQPTQIPLLQARAQQLPQHPIRLSDLSNILPPHLRFQPNIPSSQMGGSQMGGPQMAMNPNVNVNNNNNNNHNNQVLMNNFLLAQRRLFNGQASSGNQQITGGQPVTQNRAQNNLNNPIWRSETPHLRNQAPGAFQPMNQRPTFSNSIGIQPLTGPSQQQQPRSQGDPISTRRLPVGRIESSTQMGTNWKPNVQQVSQLDRDRVSFPKSTPSSIPGNVLLSRMNGQSLSHMFSSSLQPVASIGTSLPSSPKDLVSATSRGGSVSETPRLIAISSTMSPPSSTTDSTSESSTSNPTKIIFPDSDSTTIASSSRQEAISEQPIPASSSPVSLTSSTTTKISDVSEFVDLSSKADSISTSTESELVPVSSSTQQASMMSEDPPMEVTSFSPIKETSSTSQPETSPPQSISSSDTPRNELPSTTTISSTTTTTTPSDIPTTTTEVSNSGGSMSFDPLSFLRISECNVFGRIYKVGLAIEELSDTCKRCTCTSAGVECQDICG